MRACGRTSCAAAAWLILLACRSAPSAEVASKPETEVSPSAQEVKPSPPPEAAAPAAPKILFATVPERTRANYDATADKFIIASQGEATSLAAKRMFELGGNVVDAAAAASFTVAVERPQSTGVAGGGFMVVHLADKHETLAVDFRERAPARAAETMYQDKQGEVIPNRSTEGALAVGVPGMVAGVLDVHAKYGKLTRAQILAPAIELAEQGYAIYPHLAFAIARMKPVLWKSEAARSIFFDDKGEPLALGALLKQPDLAKVLRAIADKGAAGFYAGWVAKALVAEQKQQGGLITSADLTNYQVKYRPVVTDDYGPYKVVSMPPPSSGGTHVVEILNILEQAPIAQAGAYSATALSWTTAAMQLAYRDRAKYLGDSDFVTVPVKALTSDPYADSLRATIDPAKAHKATDIPGFDPFKYESKETTHFTLADHDGNIVTSTQTINGWFGSGVVVKGTGMVLNNEMDDFSAKPGVANKFGLVGGPENAIQPGKRPLSSMSPTIVFKDDKPVLALGTPSGSQIISCVALTALNYLTYKLPLYDAVSALRYHHQYLPDELVVEAPGLPSELAKDLETRGYHVRTGEIGCKIQAVAYEDGKLHAVSDPRGEGLVANETTLAPAAAKPAQNTPISAD